MRVLITGVTGFIGYSLAKRLVSDGEHEVYGLVRFTGQARKVPEGVETVIGDLTDYHSIAKLISSIKPDVVFHLASITPVSESYEQPVTYIQTNCIGTINLLEAIRKYAYEQVRLIAVAGTTELFDTEWIKPYDDFRPESPYAVSKTCEVYYAEYMFRAYGLPIVIVIPTNTYGRAFVNQPHYFIEKVITSLLRGEKVIRLGNPDAVRDWMFREDHVDAYISIMNAVLNGKDGVLGRRFAFGTGFGYSTKETAEIIKNVVSKYVDTDSVVFMWNTVNRPAESQKIVISMEALRETRNTLGWVLKYDLIRGIEQATKEWMEVLLPNKKK